MKPWIKCSKRKYADEMEAKIALLSCYIKQQGKKSDWRRKETRYYLCEICKKYHLTSQPKKLDLNYDTSNTK
jgi:hypothetical protein